MSLPYSGRVADTDVVFPRTISKGGLQCPSGDLGTEEAVEEEFWKWIVLENGTGWSPPAQREMILDWSKIKRPRLKREIYEMD